MTKAWIAWLAAVLLTFAALEAFGYWRHGVAGTLSDNVRTWTAIHPLIPFGLGAAVGALAYHFFAGFYYRG